MYLEDSKTEDLESMSDEEILELSLKNPNFYSEIVERYEDAFLRKATRVLGRREEVRDVVQETFTKIYMNASKFEEKPGAKFSSWAYKILMNTSFTYYQKLKKTGQVSHSLDEEIWAMIPDQDKSFVEKISVRDLVATSLSRMPESLARILTLHFIEDRPQKEIAEIEGISVSAVKTRIHRAKKSFKDLNMSTIE